MRKFYNFLKYFSDYMYKMPVNIDKERMKLFEQTKVNKRRGKPMLPNKQLLCAQDKAFGQIV